MKISLTFLFLAGISACMAMPTNMPSTTDTPSIATDAPRDPPSTTTDKPGATADSKPFTKDAVRMLLESSQLLQNWGNTILDTAETGLTAPNVRQLMSSGLKARQEFHETVINVNAMLKNDGESVEEPDTFHKDVAEAAVEMLKEETNLEVLSEDEKLALISGDKLAAGTARLRLNMHLFSRSMKVLDSTVDGLEDLLEDGVTDDEILEVLPEVVEMLGTEGTALGLVFKAIKENFDDAENLIFQMAEEDEDDDEDDSVEGKETVDDDDVQSDEDDDETDDDDEDESDEKKDTPRRQRRSASTFGRSSSFGFGRGSSSTFGRSSTFGSSSSTFGGSSSTFGSNRRDPIGSSSSTFGSSSSTFGSNPSSTFDKPKFSFESKPKAPFSRDLGNGWNVGLGGLSWSRGNTRFNVGPTFERGPGISAGVKIEW